MSIRDAFWIWLPGTAGGDGGDVNQYVRFRKSILLPRSRRVAGRVQIAADSDFVAFINGEEIARGQFPDWPREKTYGEFRFECDLLEGENAICVLAYYRGRDFSTYRSGEPGLIASFELGDLRFSTDGDWKCARSEAFKSGPVPPITVQLGYSVAYDARKEDGWLSASYDTSAWSRAEPRARGTAGYWRTLTPRPLPLPEIGGRKESRLIRHVRGDDSWIWIYDCGEECAGLLDLELEAPGGTEIEISHGEHLADGSVRKRIGDRSFADYYVCKEGWNEFLMPFRIVGARYLQLTARREDIEVRYLGLRPVRFALPERALFRCADETENRSESVAANTLALCMRYHYEDCPWREQALYSYDSRCQALFGYHLWGNYDFAAASFRLLGKGLRDDGFLELCAPAKVPLTIPIFSFVWITALTEHALYSGDTSLPKEFGPTIEGILDRGLGSRDCKMLLCRLPRGKEIWNFYEWVSGLDGAGVAPGEHHAPYDLYFLEALKAYSGYLNQNAPGGKGELYAAAAADLERAIVAAYWNDGLGAFASRLVDGRQEGYHVHTNCLALKVGALAPSASRAALSIMSGRMTEVSFSPLMYLIDGLMQVSPAARRYVTAFLKDKTAPIIQSGSSTFWETPKGEADFDGAGSLCHGWSAATAYFHHAYMLGIKPLAPGFARFSVAPYPAGCAYAGGAVPTPHGPIRVEWTDTGEGLDIEMTGPEEFVPVPTPYEETPLRCVRFNGALIRSRRDEIGMRAPPLHTAR